MKDQIRRIKEKAAKQGLQFNPVASYEEITRFQSAHGVSLPEEYRLFLLEIGNGGDGPPGLGIVPLGQASDDMGAGIRYWTELKDIAKPFPFTKHWQWDFKNENNPEGHSDQSWHGSVHLGNDGCGMYWHLIVAGPDIGVPWMIDSDGGIQPVCPKRHFLQWYEDWLDGLDSFYGYQPENNN